MKTTSIAFTAYPANDVPKLLAFYRDALGLSVGRAHPNEEEAQLVEFEIGNDHWLTLMPAKMLGRAAGSGVGVVFEVDDVDGMLEQVRPHAKSADEKSAEYPNCRMAWFEDPEGNKAALHSIHR